jgi:hypothetical protein
MMEAVGSSETSVFTRATQRNRRHSSERDPDGLNQYMYEYIAGTRSVALVCQPPRAQTAVNGSRGGS